MQTCPPRFRNATEAELAELREEGFSDPLPEPKKSSTRKRRRALTDDVEPMFDVRTWRVPSRWRNDKSVGDVTISKMLRGIDLARYESLARTPRERLAS